MSCTRLDLRAIEPLSSVGVSSVGVSIIVGMSVIVACVFEDIQ